MLFLDVNIWLPMVWDGHVANRRIKQWAEGRPEAFVICRVVQLALLRHLSNPGIMGDDVYTNLQGAEIITALCSQEGIIAHSDPLDIDTLFPSLGESETPNRNRWTDAYLAAFAIAGDYELVTFDRDFSRYESRGLRLTLLEM